jgi:tetratricopeptide (TPR) repeat protein
VRPIQHAIFLVLFFLLVGANTATASSAITAPPHEQLDGALRRVQIGDYLGARIMAQRHLSDADRGIAYRAHYITGISWELSNQCEPALLAYENARKFADNLDQKNDTWFRSGECLGALGEHRAAVTHLRNIHDLTTPGDKSKKRIVTAILKVRKRSNWWTRWRLRKAISKPKDTGPAFYLAKGHIVLAHTDIVRADKLPIKGRQRKMKRALTKRAKLVANAEAHTVAAVALKEPEWILEGLLTLAYASESAGDALLNSPIPKLSDEQKEAYRAIIGKRVETMWTRSIAYLDEGTALANKTQWRSPRVAQIQRARELLVQRIDLGAWGEAEPALFFNARRGTMVSQNQAYD